MKERIKKDKGNSVIVLGIFVVGMILISAVLIVDLGKSMYIKNLYSSFARKAVQTAVKEQDHVGGLKPESASKMISEYMIQRNGNVNTRDAQSHFSTCDTLGKYPIVEITYDSKRQKDAVSVTYESISGAEPYIPKKNDFFKNSYNTIEVNITDVTDNYFFGIFGKPCAEIHLRASGITTTTFDESEFHIDD